MIGLRQFLPALVVVLIPAGEFTMGRTKLTPDDNTKMRPRVLLDDRPAHKV
jgi:formylglycine-generating enzyme required for sulfatase activity